MSPSYKAYITFCHRFKFIKKRSENYEQLNNKFMVDWGIRMPCNPNKTYEELQNQKYERGFHIIALKRKEKWIYSFKSDFIFQEGDLIIGLGPKETVDQWKKCVHPESNL